MIIAHDAKNEDNDNDDAKLQLRQRSIKMKSHNAKKTYNTDNPM